MIAHSQIDSPLLNFFILSTFNSTPKENKCHLRSNRYLIGYT